MTSIPAGAAQFRNRSFKSTDKSYQTAFPHLQSPVASATSEVNTCTISSFQTTSPVVVAPSMISEDSEDVEHGGGGCGGVGVEEWFFSFVFLVLVITGEKLDKNFGYAKNLEDKYELGKELGRGNFGYTCSAYAKNGSIKNQMVAVKIISKDKMTSFQSIEDVRREVRLLKALSGHRHMIKFYDVFEDEDNVFVVTELCEGGELYGRILARGGPYPEADAKRILIQILSATAFFHLQGVVHGDLKPENFLFTSKKEDAILKVIDFGSSNFARIDQRLTDAIASVRYVAPEVLDRSYSIETDIWSIGVMSYMLLTGYRPFYGRTDSAIFQCVLKANPDFEGLTWPSISPIAKDFVKRLLNKDHRKRMTAAQSLAHPWLRDENPDLILDFCIYKLVKSYICASPFRQAALKSLSKAIPEEGLVFLKAQFMLLGPEDEGLYLHNFTTALTRYATDAMIECRLPDILNMMRPLAHRKLDFEEFCAAAVSVYQLEALEEWEKISSLAFDHFELEGNKVITVQELAEEMSLGPNEYPTLKNWIRSLDGKLTFFGYTKFLLSDCSKLELVTSNVADQP